MTPPPVSQPVTYIGLGYSCCGEPMDCHPTWCACVCLSKAPIVFIPCRFDTIVNSFCRFDLPPITGFRILVFLFQRELRQTEPMVLLTGGEYRMHVLHRSRDQLIESSLFLAHIEHIWFLAHVILSLSILILSAELSDAETVGNTYI